MMLLCGFWLGDTASTPYWIFAYQLELQFQFGTGQQDNQSNKRNQSGNQNIWAQPGGAQPGKAQPGGAQQAGQQPEQGAAQGWVDPGRVPLRHQVKHCTQQTGTR